MAGRQSKLEVLVDVFNLILGTFLALMPWTFGLMAAAPTHRGVTADVVNAWTTGLTIDLAAAAAIIAFAEWQEWVNFFAGLWTVGSPWFLGFGGNGGARWAQVAVGGAVAGLAAFELCLLDRRSAPRPGRTLKLIDVSTGAVSEFVIPRHAGDPARQRPATVLALQTAWPPKPAAGAGSGAIARVPDGPAGEQPGPPVG